MKMSRYSKACNTDSKFKKLLFDADADVANAAGNKKKSYSSSANKKKSSANKKKSSADVSKNEMIVYSHSSAGERTKFHQSQVLTSPRVSTVSPRMSSVLTSPGVSQEHGTITTGIPFIAGDHVIIGPDQNTMYARASVGTLSILFSIVFIVLTDYCLRRCW